MDVSSDACSPKAHEKKKKKKKAFDAILSYHYTIVTGIKKKE